MKTTTLPMCCSTVGNGLWCQETYETARRDAGIRAKQLRKAGYSVTVSPMGSQVTPLGMLKLTMVDIRPGVHQDVQYLPEVDRVEWPR